VSAVGHIHCEVQVGGHIGNSQRFVALVDVADAEMVGAYRWHMVWGYAVRKVYVGDKQLGVRMNRELLGLVPGDPDVDHINGNKLDNRRGNLRVCTNAQNHQNRHRPGRGATWDARRNRWRARVMLAGKQHNLGYFATREEAADAAAAFRREHMPFSSDARNQAIQGDP
jgi:hypothetical protein